MSYPDGPTLSERSGYHQLGSGPTPAPREFPATANEELKRAAIVNMTTKKNIESRPPRPEFVETPLGNFAIKGRKTNRGETSLWSWDTKDKQWIIAHRGYIALMSDGTFDPLVYVNYEMCRKVGAKRGGIVVRSQDIERAIDQQLVTK